MKFLLYFALGALTLFGPNTPKSPLRFKSGDVLTVSSPASEYAGDFTVMSDGAIYGRGFGRVLVEGKTFDETQAAVRTALKKFVKEDMVFLSIRQVRQDVVYLAGNSGGKGSVAYTPGLTVRQLLANASFPDDMDLNEVQLFREGKPILKANAADLMRSGSDKNDAALEPNDVITVSPTPFIRIWMSGLLASSGQIKVPEGSDLYRAISAAGGLNLKDALDGEAKILVRRGSDVFTFPARQDIGAKALVLEAGDTISVEVAEATRVIVTGEVNKPGEYTGRSNTSLLGAIALAGGATSEGTLGNVLVFRKGEMFQYALTNPSEGKADPGVSLQTGDLVYVRKNENVIYTLGEVAKPGKILMEPDKQYRLADALGLAGGLSSKGTFRRVYLARAGADGKTKVTQYNLDEFLRDGKDASNPILQPGDTLLFGQPRGVTLSGITQVLSSAILFESITRK